MPTLAEYLDQRPTLPLPDAMAIIRAVAVEVIDLHRMGQVHGAICDQNIMLDDALRPRLTDHDPDRATVRTGHERQVAALGHRDRVPAQLISRLQGAAILSDEADAEPPSSASLDTAVDPRQADVYGLAELLCRMLTGASVDAYLRSPRVKGLVAQSVQPLLDRVLGGRRDEQALDATGFVEALDIAFSQASADPATIETAVQLEVVDSTSSCITGIQIGDSTAAKCEVPPAREADLPFQKLGHYQINSRLGHGGMGEVYLGYESGLDRQVAIKVLPARFARDPDLIRRFHAEAMAAAKLVHPNILQIYYIGEDQGHAFFAMQYVEGMSLARLMAQGRRLTLDEALAISDEVLSGIEAAHKLGLIHRDIKPGNILLDKVHRRALLADFGLVKSLQESGPGHTSSGMILGTADYIAPEQGLGKAVDCRCDLYSMGVVMYQMLCGRLPFIARESTAVIFQHVYVAPPALGELAPHIPPALAVIVERLLAKSPGDRYQSATDVLVDLRAFRAGASITGVTDGLGTSEQVAAEGRLPVASPAGMIDTSPMAGQPTSARSRSPTDVSPAGPDRGRRRIVLALAGAAGLPAVAGAYWFALGRQPRATGEHTGLLATGVSATGRSGSDARVPVEIRKFGDHASEVNCFALSSDEGLLIVGDRTSKLSVWDFRMTEQRKSFRAHSGPIRRVIVTADGKFAVTASADQTLKLWNLATWKQVTQFNGHVDGVTSVVQVPGRDEIVSSSFDGRLRRWSMNKGTPLAWYGDKPLDESEPADASERDPQKIERHIAWVRDLVIPAEGNQIISAGNDRVILIWDLESAQVVDRLIEHRAPVMCLAVSPDGSRLLSGGFDKTLCLWDLGARKLIRHMPHDSATPACVAFSPDGQQALSGGADGLIHVWDVATGNEQHVLEAHEGTVTSLRFTADGRQVVSGGEDRTVRVWRLPRTLSASSAS